MLITLTRKNRFADGVEGSAIRFDPTQPIYSAGSIYGVLWIL
jgi:iron complex outermembrane receptor protein